jgi:GGDEF domain-containing protein
VLRQPSLPIGRTPLVGAEAEAPARPNATQRNRPNFERPLPDPFGRPLVARYGGEELVVLLPDTDAAGAEAVAERLRAEIEALGLPHEGFGVAGAVVTVSVGLATARPAAPGVLPAAGSLVGAADRALYEAKRGGRNRVVQAPPPELLRRYARA